MSGDRVRPVDAVCFGMADHTPPSRTPRDITSLAEPQDEDLLQLYRLWHAKRGTRALPSRTDFDPREFPRLLPNVMLVDLLPAPDFYRVRLVGQVIIDFYGRNVAGLTPREYLAPDALAAFGELIQQLVTTRQPLCRTGRVYWQKDKTHKQYESCLMPLGSDGETVDKVLAAIKFAS
jgi:hypothetical protein